MGVAPIGNNIWEGPLKVVSLKWNNIELGKTTSDTELAKNEDIKDIIYQQDGTQYHDKVPTGISYQINATFGEIDTELLEEMHDSMVKSGDGNSLKIGKNLFHSWREQAKELEVTAVDGDGDDSTDALQKMIYLKTYPEITSPIVWGADSQRNLAITFHLFYDTDEDCFGYNGYATSLGITP